MEESEFQERTKQYLEEALDRISVLEDENKDFKKAMRIMFDAPDKTANPYEKENLEWLKTFLEITDGA